MRASDFDYDLPEEKIACYPPEERGSTRMLVVDRASGALRHAWYAALDEFLEPGDLLVLNNTKVVRARLHALKQTGAKIELMLLEKHQADQDRVLYRGKLKKGDTLVAHDEELLVSDIVDDGIARIEFRGGSQRGSIRDFFERFGAVPIPPYLKRDAEEVDRERYQTVFAELPGSVAAPTASLNMTPALLQNIRLKGVAIASVTLHVGLGTFLPIRVESLREHVMHREYYSISAETVEKIRKVKAAGGRIVAVGTTVTRALEHAAGRIVRSSCRAGDAPITGEADIFIFPGYSFQVIDALLTNFHAPRSTVLMLTAAFAGAGHLKRAYQSALEEGYFFLSYGDSMLIV
ncbi:tRNA preQ1(34) S-adenosylmethionine ribosyltransferase-isomerase QueA [Chlorobium sp. BLA1]|uniref:tRNA preQ1(34) S-adenosylmethionine ribosyltransferase-isomerase QueA n=1 Tax=Candidatus Chlorobium masyuteum TaxID=2716876 RepID=UPI0014205939|nr:tRNA preQ1(34) S-adenosylmethionine ribosyltransferase-isomerase QueA [Candidatus Chlorobium masyuteum]NHQ60690.1 tRNA preQ1(34) S-adenosylmethionine ribosyltransferase-isomerase QueA [Candidatus Chlorobium masyuteum]